MGGGGGFGLLVIALWTLSRREKGLGRGHCVMFLERQKTKFQRGERGLIFE